jgi:superoxide dismutase, Cu-Zn family
MRSVLTFMVCMSLAASIAGCAKQEPVAAGPAAGELATVGAASQAAAPAAPAASAVAEAEAAPPTALVALAPTKGHKTSGTLNLEFAKGVLQVTGQISGLTPDADHGFHVHEKGDCKAPDASSAGGHFNPSSQPHGSPDAAAHHVGDMLNIHADAMGNAMVSLKLAGMTLKDGGPDDIKGKAIVVHEKADDYTTQPSGNSGGRIACGVIG